MTFLGLAVGILATFRLTLLLVEEQGPLDVFARLRWWAAARSSFLGSLLDCFWCTSVWVAAPIAVCVISRWQEWPIAWLALSGGAVALYKALGIETETTVQGQPSEEL